MVPKEYAEAIGERTGYVGYNFCLVLLKPNVRKDEIAESFKNFLANEGKVPIPPDNHLPEDNVFGDSYGHYLALVEGSSNSFRYSRNLPPNHEARSVDDLVARFLFSEASNGKPFDVSVGIAEYNKNAGSLYAIAMLAQRRWFLEDGELVSRDEFARAVKSFDSSLQESLQELARFR